MCIVIQDNVAHMRTVKPGVTEGEMTQVEGINPGDVVANSSFEKLQDKTPGVRGADARRLVRVPQPRRRKP